MKNLDNENLKKIYHEPPESFHNAVVSTLEGLEESKTIRYRKHRTIIRIAAACAAIAVVGTFAVAAAATDFFGLTATKKGTYGLNVTVESSVSDAENSEERFMLDFGYMPEKYAEGKMFGNYEFSYQKDIGNFDDYFHSYIHEAKGFNIDLLNVIESSETEIDGHKVVYVTIKEAENSDRLYYSSYKYFDKENLVVQCSGSDHDELVKITENLGLKPAEKTSYDEDEDEDYNGEKRGAILEYYYNNHMRLVSDYFDNRVKKVGIGESMEFNTADYGQKAVKLTAKVVSLEKRDNADGLDIAEFDSTTGKNVYYDHFNSDGSLIRTHEFQTYDEGDEEHLGKIEQHTGNRNFYVADIELTAEEDIDNLYDVFGFDVAIIDDEKRCYIGNFDEDYSEAYIIYGTWIDNNIAVNNTVKIKKGETVTLKSGFILETVDGSNEIDDNVYFLLSAVDEPNDSYQNYMLKVKK